jgi:nucleoid-associated protein YgaU
MRAAGLGAIAAVLCLALYAAARFASAPGSGEGATPARLPPSAAALPDVAAAARTRAAGGAEPPAAEPAADADATYDTAAALESARRHVVRDGDSLASIAKQFYGDAARAQEIYEANRDRIRDPAQLHAGQVLSIP